MASSGFAGIDMNNLVTLGHYSQMLLFKNDISQEELLFYHPSTAEQRTLQSLAHNLELEYEYSVAAKTARIVRSIASPTMSPDGLEYFDFDQFHLPDHSKDAHDTNLNISSFIEDDIHAPTTQGGFSGDLVNNTSRLESGARLMDPPQFQSPDMTSYFLAGRYRTLSIAHNSTPKLNQTPILQSQSCNQPSDSEGLEISRAPAQSRRYSSTPRRDSSVFDSSIGPASYTPSKFSSRKGSVHSNTSAGYQEIVFDSNSIYSDGQISNASVGSGRRGPLSEMARVGMNAVKQVGACWRCKFLRNKCNTDSPCALCPLGEKSKWAAVGCRRGRFVENLQPVDICLKPQHPRLGFSGLEHSLEQEASKLANRSFHLGCERREEWLLGTTPLRKFEQQTRDSFLRNIASASKQCSHPPNLAELKPLEHCVLAIVWELLERPLSLPIIDSAGTFENIGLLLPLAAVYQATYESNQLIAQSLICLRSCLEVLRVQVSGTMNQKSHQDCYASCKIECVLNLKINCSLYLKELNRVFFQKKNLRNKDSSWLSTFYSFCIQALVRRAIIKIIRDPSVSDIGTDEQEPYDHEDYMQLPVRLFIASGSNYDMIVDSRSVQASTTVGDSNQAKSKGAPSLEDILSARLAIGYSEWASTGITNSYDYLKKIFEDDGNEIKTYHPSIEDFSSAPKNNRCKVCDKSFMRPSSLQTHMYSHIGESPTPKNLKAWSKSISTNNTNEDSYYKQIEDEALKSIPCMWCVERNFDCDGVRPLCGRCKDEGRILCTRTMHDVNSHSPSTAQYAGGKISTGIISKLSEGHQTAREKRKRSDSHTSRSKPLSGRFRSMLDKTVRSYSERSL